MAQDIGKRRLNPCFSGTYSRRYSTLRNFDEQEVLILVLVEHTLGVEVSIDGKEELYVS